MKVDVKEFMFVTALIVTTLMTSFILLGTDHIYEVSMGFNSHYEIPQRFLFALFGLVLGAIVVIVMAFVLVIQGKL